MTKVKLCGLSRESDIAAVNKLKPDLVGFVFAKKSKRYVSPEQAAALKSLLAPGILAAGVFVNEPVEAVAELLDRASSMSRSSTAARMTTTSRACAR